MEIGGKDATIETLKKEKHSKAEEVVKAQKVRTSFLEWFTNHPHFHFLKIRIATVFFTVI